MLNKSLFTSNKDEYATPTDLFNELDKKYHFTLDPCATSENAKCKKYYTIKENGLLKSWKGEIVFCNPPYSKIKLWVEKCFLEFKNNNATIVLLIPARTDTQYFHNYILNQAKIIFLKGRLHFNNSKNSAPFPSILCIYEKEGEK